MTDGENYIPEAKCFFHQNCPVYRGGFYKDTVEIELCGKGNSVDKNFIPRFHKIYTPDVKGIGSPVEYSVCPAFVNSLDRISLARIREILEKNDWFWNNEKSIDIILNKP